MNKTEWKTMIKEDESKEVTSHPEWLEKSRKRESVKLKAENK
jgi:hypothetical protein